VGTYFDIVNELIDIGAVEMEGDKVVDTVASASGKPVLRIVSHLS